MMTKSPWESFGERLRKVFAIQTPPHFLRLVNFDGVPELRVRLAGPAFRHRKDIDDGLFATFLIAAGTRGGLGFRGVSRDRLDYVYRVGIDVEPSDSAVWVTDSLEKALEYGGDTPVVLVLDMASMRRHLDRTPLGNVKAQPGVRAVFERKLQSTRPCAQPRCPLRQVRGRRPDFPRLSTSAHSSVSHRLVRHACLRPAAQPPERRPSRSRRRLPPSGGEQQARRL